MKFISSAKLVVCGNLPNIFGFFLKEEREIYRMNRDVFFFIKFIFG